MFAWLVALLARTADQGTVPPVRVPDDDAVSMELHALTRRHAGLVHQRRMEHLARVTRTDELAVRHSTLGFAGDRMTLHVDNGFVLRLSLLWPRWQHVAAICGIRWSDRLGWILTARTTAGERIQVCAWRAAVQLPRAGVPGAHV